VSTTPAQRQGGTWRRSHLNIPFQYSSQLPPWPLLPVTSAILDRETTAVAGETRGATGRNVAMSWPKVREHRHPRFRRLPLMLVNMSRTMPVNTRFPGC
jgi:hypothetical protein